MKKILSLLLVALLLAISALPVWAEETPVTLLCSKPSLGFEQTEGGVELVLLLGHGSESVAELFENRQSYRWELVIGSESYICAPSASEIVYGGKSYFRFSLNECDPAFSPTPGERYTVALRICDGSSGALLYLTDPIENFCLQAGEDTNTLIGSALSEGNVGVLALAGILLVLGIGAAVTLSKKRKPAVKNAV